MYRCAYFEILCLLLASFVGDAFAIEWAAGTGDFLEPSNWSAGFVPMTPDGCVVTNGGTARLSHGVVDVSEFTLGYVGGDGRFEQTGGTFNAAATAIGQQGNGVAQISGGHFAIGTDSIHVGWLPGGTGEMWIDGHDALVTSADDFQLGRQGTGTLHFSAGQLRAGFTVVGKYGSGTWNQSGGLFDQDFGDVEIGDGGGDSDVSTVGPRTGVMDISGGYLQTAGHFSIGNRRGNGLVNIRGGFLAATGSPDSNIFIGRGNDSSPGSGGETELRVVGDQATIIATGGLFMNPNNVATSSTLIAVITGPTHTPIRVAGNADIDNGDLKIELNGYVPSSNDTWVLLEAGSDLASDISLLELKIDEDGYDELVHALPEQAGQVVGEFQSIDTSLARLPAGLSWEIGYTPKQVFLGVTGTPGLLGDFDGNGKLDTEDIDALMNEVAAGSTLAAFDLNSDSHVDDQDRDAWLAAAGASNGLASPYLVGDANLDGAVDARDLNELGLSWLTDNHDWSRGNFTGGGANAADLNALALNWRQSVPVGAAVPEPSSLLLALGLLAGWSSLSRFGCQCRSRARRPSAFQPPAGQPYVPRGRRQNQRAAAAVPEPMSDKAWSQGDFVPDGTVNASDLMSLAINWRAEIPRAAARVPEPMSFLLLLVGAPGVYRSATTCIAGGLRKAPQRGRKTERQGASRRCWTGKVYPKSTGG